MPLTLFALIDGLLATASRLSQGFMRLTIDELGKLDVEVKSIEKAQRAVNGLTY